jgi:hypothetical protein
VTDYVKPQPPPEDRGASPVWPEVISDAEFVGSCDNATGKEVWPLLAADMRQRDAQGRAKYGVPLTQDNGRGHAADAYQEALDGTAYWRCEWKSSGRIEALTLYHEALRHAHRCRVYLLARDGK